MLLRAALTCTGPRPAGGGRNNRRVVELVLSLFLQHTYFIFAPAVPFLFCTFPAVPFALILPRCALAYGLP